MAAMWRRTRGRRRESSGSEQEQQTEAQGEPENVESLMIKADSMVTALVMGSIPVQRETVRMLRLMSKLDDEHRITIADAGAIPHLLHLLSSPDAQVQEDAITCLLNLSIAQLNKARIMATRGALEKVVDTLRMGARPESRRNAAVCILSIAITESYRDVIGQRPLVISGLLDLIPDTSSARDAIKTLFQLALCPSNKPRIVKAGAIPLLLNFFQEQACHEQMQLANDGLALLTQLCACAEGVSEVCNGEGRLGMLVDLLEPGSTNSSRTQEHAAAALLALCESGGDTVVSRLVDQFQGCISALCGLLSTGSQRARFKAGMLMQLLVVSDRPSLV